MARESSIVIVTRIAEPWFGAFRGQAAMANGVSRKQLGTLHQHGVIERLLRDTYRLTAAPRCHEQILSAGLLWAGDNAVADRRSASMLYGLEGIRAVKPEVVVPSSVRCRSDDVVIRRCDDRRSLMVRRVRGLPVTGVEATLLALACDIDPVALEIACEDARRRQLTTIPALYAYLDRFAASGRPSVGALRRLLRELDPKHPSRSKFEVLTRRLLVANRITGFTREFPIEWGGRTHRFDFAFERQQTILETNGRRWHDDPADHKITRRPHEFLGELVATLEQRPSRLT